MARIWCRGCGLPRPVARRADQAGEASGLPFSTTKVDGDLGRPVAVPGAMGRAGSDLEAAARLDALVGLALDGEFDLAFQDVGGFDSLDGCASPRPRPAAISAIASTVMCVSFRSVVWMTVR